MDAEQLDELARAAELHDIGKVGIPDAILDKPGELDADEWDFVRQHTILGERILSAAPALRPVARSCAPATSGGTAAAIPTACRRGDPARGADRRRLRRLSRRSPATGATGRPGALDVARDELLREAGRQFDPAVVGAFLEELDQPQDALVAVDEDETPRQFAEEVAARFRQMLEHQH